MILWKAVKSSTPHRFNIELLFRVVTLISTDIIIISARTFRVSLYDKRWSSFHISFYYRGVLSVGNEQIYYPKQLLCSRRTIWFAKVIMK